MIDVTDTPRSPVIVIDLLNDAEVIPDTDLDRMLALALERA